MASPGYHDEGREHRHLWLIGMMGSGKSSVGRPLSARLGMRFVDTDAGIERDHAASIAELFATHGEPWFRLEEERAVAALAAEPDPAVVATGGGVVLSSASREVMRATGLVVWLFADLATVIGRVGMGEDRPLIGRANPVASMDHLMVDRYDVYSSVADAQISTIDRDVTDVVDEVEAMWQLR